MILAGPVSKVALSEQKEFVELYDRFLHEKGSIRLVVGSGRRHQSWAETLASSELYRSGRPARFVF